jgi:hypothetical protein
MRSKGFEVGIHNDITGKCKIHWKTQIILALKNAPSYI